MNREKLSERDKYFWSNFFQGLIIVAGAIFLTSYIGDPVDYFDIFQGLSVVGFFSTIGLVGKIAMDMTNRAYPVKKEKLK